MTELYMYIMLGLVIGYVGGFAGIGGGPFLVSFLVLYFGMSQLTAQGHILTMMLGPMSLLGVMALYDEVKKMWLNIILGVIFYCISSYFGAVLAFSIGEENAKIYFSILLFTIAGIQIASLTFLKNKEEGLDKKISLAWYWAAFLGAFTGFFGGMLGIGAGVLMVPILMYIFKIKKEYARALSLAILVPPVSYGAYLKYNIEVDISWVVVFALFGSYFVSNYFGAKMGTKASPRFFKTAYSIVLVFLGFVYLIS